MKERKEGQEADRSSEQMLIHKGLEDRALERQLGGEMLGVDEKIVPDSATGEKRFEYTKHPFPGSCQHLLKLRKINLFSL